MPKNIEAIVVCLITNITIITVAKLRRKKTYFKKNATTFNNPSKEHTVAEPKPQSFVKEMLTPYVH